jgi:hypothetical protein
MKINLKKPVTFEGKDYTEINAEFDNLTGQDLIDATNEARARGDQSVIIELSKLYQAIVAAKAAKVPIDMVIAMNGKDFVTVTKAAQSFLLE